MQRLGLDDVRRSVRLANLVSHGAAAIAEAVAAGRSDRHRGSGGGRTLAGIADQVRTADWRARNVATCSATSAGRTKGEKWVASSRSVTSHCAKRS